MWTFQNLILVAVQSLISDWLRLILLQCKFTFNHLYDILLWIIKQRNTPVSPKSGIHKNSFAVLWFCYLNNTYFRYCTSKIRMGFPSFLRFCHTCTLSNQSFEKSPVYPVKGTYIKRATLSWIGKATSSQLLVAGYSFWN